MPGAAGHHFSKPESHPLTEYQGRWDSYRPGEGHLVFDRFHLGERVWPTIFGRPSDFDEAMCLHVELFLQSRGAVVIYATRDLELLRDELADEPIDLVGAERAEELFCQALQDRVEDTVMYDYARSDTSDLPMIITEAHQRQCAARKIFKVTSEWIGNPRPRVLLVGEQFNTPPESGVHAA